MSDYELIKSVVNEQGYDDRLSGFLCSMFRYMNDRQWIGACHATCSVMYVALSEMGYDVELCMGEVESAEGKLCFDHSWLLLDGKIVDLAAAMTLMGGLPVSNPIVLDKDIRTGEKFSLYYGIYRSGLDREAQFVKEVPFVKYMDSYPDAKGGLWTVLSMVYSEKIDIEKLKQKYEIVDRQYVCNREGV